MRKFILILTCFLWTAKLFGQVTVTGHITAEIVEGVEVSPKMFHEFEVCLLSDEMELCEIILSSDEIIACNVILEFGKLVDIYGNRVTLETSVAEDENKLRFLASTRNLRNKKTNIFEGAYSLMLLYE